VIKSISLFFLKNNNIFFFISLKSNSQHKHAKWLPSDLTPWTLTSRSTGDISANLNNIFGLFTTHSFTNSSGAVSSYPSSSQKSKKPSFSLKKFKNPFSGLRDSSRGKRYPQQPGKPIFLLFSTNFLMLT
jgi:hypothetical protein